jgi:hypothetical protein
VHLNDGAVERDGLNLDLDDLLDLKPLKHAL